MPSSLTLFDGAPLLVPLDGFDADGDALAYTVSSTNPTIVPILHEGNRSLRIHVVHQGDESAGDPSFEGDLVFELFEDWAPHTTARIIELVQSGFYDGVIFHRVAVTGTGEHFVIQGGDPTGTGTGGSHLPNLDDEFHHDLQHTSVGVLSMSKHLDDTNNSQFFITGYDTRSLDFNHSVFGRLVEGEDLRQKIAAVPVGDQERPTRPVTMTSVTVFNDTQNKVLTLKTGFGTAPGESATITVTASDGSGGAAIKTFTVTTQADPVDNAPFVWPAAAFTIEPNRPSQFHFPYTDIDGGSPPHFEVLPSGNPDLESSMDPVSGIITLTPKNGLSGVHSIFLRVRDATSGFDTQQAPVYIRLPAPGRPQLHPDSDTGFSRVDRTTRLDNSNEQNRLQFTLTDLVPGAEVSLYFENSILIGRAIVPPGESSLTIVTNGTADIPDGPHTIAAAQILRNQPVKVGNLDTTVDLTSAFSELLMIVDTSAPAITSTAPVLGEANVQYDYDVHSTEEIFGLGRPPVYDLIEAPAGATINQFRGQIAWTPSEAQIGPHIFKVRASDRAGNADEQVFTVTVEPQHSHFVPALNEIPPQTATEGLPFTLDVNATDADGPSDTLVFSLLGNPAGIEIDPASGVITWTPDESAGGTTLPITVRVTDTFGLSDEATFELTVNEVNQPPVIDPIGDRFANVGFQLSFNVPGRDADRPPQTLTYALQGDVPAGAAINPATGTFTWIPADVHAGQTFNVTVRVTDSLGLSDEESFALSVFEIHRRPSIEPIGEKFVDDGQELTFQVVVSDTDPLPDAYFFWLNTGAPPAAHIQPATGVFSWTPDPADGAKSFEITVVVSDNGLVDSETFTVHVAPRLQTFFQVLDGNLIVNGTSGNDGVAIRGTGAFGQYAITGTLGTETVSGVTGDIRVDLGDGNDWLRLNDAHVAGNITLNLGTGADELSLGELGSVSTARNLAIDLGGGDDRLLMHRTFTHGDQAVDGGTGNDHITIVGLNLDGRLWVGTSSGGATTVRGGAGDDSIRMSYSHIVGPWTIDGGAGGDSISVVTSSCSSAASFLGGDGHDLVAIEINYFVAAAALDGGLGSDHLILQNSILLQSATLTGGDGHDWIEAINNTSRVLRASGGAGLDFITIRASLVEQLFADLGDDNDVLALQWNLVHGLAEADGGLGLDDRLIDQGNLFRGIYRKRRFESFG